MCGDIGSGPLESIGCEDGTFFLLVFSDPAAVFEEMFLRQSKTSVPNTVRLSITSVQSI
ncbi:hypothetical protein [Thermaerobacillus caldiproteolyticus]|uniref:Uncharacterized protein n=1 Tax=Thermaerobacillus caldiproteolyticus TaxID=247480 RepID=A0A7W0BZP7_9BACL|nr:hypothetical protein [Anoxybacillus caldiproteolyticus]MBA2875845.1 hypothetical protein [Anoxybacillus caldiproteolyticus]